MLAIYKKEVRSYLTSMLGYVFIAFALLLTGFYFSAYLSYGYPYFYYTLSSIRIFFLVLIPIISMRVLADESRQKTDQLILTAPVSVGSIILGKYLALVTILAIPSLIMGLYPLIMSQFGSIDFASTYVAYVGFLLLQCAQLAIGLFFSSITESQILAAVMTFGALFISFMMSAIITIIPTSAAASFWVYVIIIFLAAYLVYSLLKNTVLACVIGGIAEAILIAVYVFKSTLLEGSLTTVLGALDLSTHWTSLTVDILDLNSIVYFIAVITFFLYLTMQSIQKRRWS